MSNEKQMGMGLMMYVGDYDETYPWAASSIGASQKVNLAWSELIFPYVKNADAYMCPSQMYLQNSTANYLLAGPRNFAANSEVLAFYSGSSGGDGKCGTVTRRYNNVIRAMADIPEPAATVALFDTASTGTVFNKAGFSAYAYGIFTDRIACEAANDPKVNPSPSNRNGEDYAGLVRHSSGANYTFADGHAKWYLPQQTLRPSKSVSPTGNLWMWDKDTFTGF